MGKELPRAPQQAWARGAAHNGLRPRLGPARFGNPTGGHVLAGCAVSFGAGKANRHGHHQGRQTWGSGGARMRWLVLRVLSSSQSPAQVTPVPTKGGQGRT